MSKELTKEDWVEIYYAVLDKSQEISSDLKWKEHLNRILDTIGPDGENMTG